MSQVSLRSVCKQFADGTEAVKDASFGVENKEFVVLVGPSGCGKSTILRMIAGLTEVTSGEIYLGNRVINDVPPKDRDIAMVFQNYALYPHMTVFENMAFGLKLRGYPKAEIAHRVKEAAEILGIQGLLERKPKELSGGQQQRVAVGRAIVRKPMVFLFDEPLSNLDAKMRVQMRTEIHKLHTRLQATMIYVTHDQVEAMTMGNRIVVLKDGQVQQIADPMSLYNHPVNRFVAGFIGTPPMNFMSGRLIRRNGAFVFDEGTFQVKVMKDMAPKVAAYEGQEVIFGVRPEDIYDKLFVTDSSPETTIAVTVDVVEPMGSEVHLHVTTGKHNLTAAVSSHTRPQINQEIEVVIDMTKIHLFDPTTDLAIV